MALSPRDTTALRATAARRMEDLVDEAILADVSQTEDDRPALAQHVVCWVPDGLITKAEWNLDLRPIYLAAEWYSAEWGVTADGREFVELWAVPPGQRDAGAGEGKVGE